MTNDERSALEKEWTEISERLSNSTIPNPKDIRRKDEITSLLMTDGEQSDLQFRFVKGRGGNKGMNATKKYNRKGPVG